MNQGVAGSTSEANRRETPSCSSLECESARSGIERIFQVNDLFGFERSAATTFDWRLSMNTTKIRPMNKALVAGALGVTGRTLVNHLASLGNWEVIGLSRRSPEFRTTAQFIAVDLLNRSEVETRLSGIGNITHIFYAAL